MKIVPVPGTHAWRGEDSRDWYSPTSALMDYLSSLDDPVQLLEPERPYVWSTDLGGLGFGDGDLAVWKAAGENLFQFLVPWRCPERRVPPDETVIISHSHGRQPVLIAAALGLKIDLFVDVCGPIRRGRYMRRVTTAARPNIRRFVRIYAGRKDFWQVLGQLGDWRLRLSRADPMADENFSEPEADHGDILRTPQYFPVVARALLNAAG